MSLTLMELGELQQQGPLAVIEKCQEWGLIPQRGAYMCPLCGSPLKLTVSKKAKDGYHWVCNSMVKNSNKKRVKCTKQVSIRVKTFFQESKLSITQIVGFMALWVNCQPLETMTSELKISHRTAVDWASFCREVVYNAMMENQQPIGGDGKVVEIDESKFTKRKFNVGRVVEDNWVFGGYERGTGRVFMVPVERRTREILFEIIHKWILPGTEIISDCWKAYSGLDNEGYSHKTVNHSLHFVDPITKAHTNSIESAWRHAKAEITPSNRRSGSLDGNLARHMLRKKAKADGENPILTFYRLAGQLYNPLHQNYIINQIARPAAEDTTRDEEDDVDDYY